MKLEETAQTKSGRVEMNLDCHALHKSRTRIPLLLVVRRATVVESPVMFLLIAWETWSWRG